MKILLSGLLLACLIPFASAEAAPAEEDPEPFPLCIQSQTTLLPVGSCTYETGHVPAGHCWSETGAFGYFLHLGCSPCVVNFNDRIRLLC